MSRPRGPYVAKGSLVTVTVLVDKQFKAALKQILPARRQSQGEFLQEQGLKDPELRSTYRALKASGDQANRTT